MPTEPPESLENWADRFEEADLFGRAKLLGGGAVRVTANAVDFLLKRGAKAVVDAEKAFRGEMDPNVSDAKVIEEVEER